MSAIPSSGHGPSAFGGDFRRFWALTLTLARTDFKLRFFGSALGYAWSLMRPLMFFGVLYFFFSEIAHLGDKVHFYAVYLLTSIVFFTYFGEVAGACVNCLVNRESMLRKVRFPRIVIPLAVSLTALFNLGMNLIAVFVFAFATGVTPRLTWLELIPLILLLVVLSTGVGMLLSALYVRYRDVQPIWEVFAQLLFYATPIIYVIDPTVPLNLRHYIAANPLAAIVTQMRHAVLDPHAKDAAQVIGGTPRLLIPLGIVFGVFALGLWFFNREAPRIAENL